MLLRRLYQITGWVLVALGALSLVSSVFRVLTGDAPLSGLFLGLTLAAFLGACGYVVFDLATGPARGNLHYYGVDDKAEKEKQKSLARKPQPAPRAR